MKMYEITFRVPKQKSMSTDQITTRKMKANNFSEVVEYWSTQQDNILKIEVVE